jgi:hypothetical protein
MAAQVGADDEQVYAIRQHQVCYRLEREIEDRLRTTGHLVRLDDSPGALRSASGDRRILQVTLTDFRLDDRASGQIMPVAPRAPIGRKRPNEPRESSGISARVEVIGRTGVEESFDVVGNDQSFSGGLGIVGPRDSPRPE